MSRYTGSVLTNRRSTAVRGDDYVQATAQSYEGSVQVAISRINGVETVTITKCGYCSSDPQSVVGQFHLDNLTKDGARLNLTVTGEAIELPFEPVRTFR